MAFTLAALLAQVDGQFDADNDIISLLRRYRLLKAAVEQYSKDRPDEETDDVVGDGGKYYGMVASLSEWQEQFSFIRRIEYPAQAVSTDHTPVYLAAGDWIEDYWVEVTGTQTRYLFLPSHSPAATETMRITYAVPYNWTASTTNTAVTQSSHGFAAGTYVYLDGATWYSGAEPICTHIVTGTPATDSFTASMLQCTIPRADFFAACDLAACLICRAMAAKFAKSGESTIRADSVQHVSKTQEYALRAKEFCEAYQRHMGLGEFASQEIGPAGEFVDWDTEPEWPSGRRFLTHHGGLR